MTTQDIITKIKENLALIGWVGSALVTLASTAIAIDARYARAEEVQKFKAEQNQAIYQTGISQAISIDKLRKDSLEDKIFEIEAINPAKRTDIDRAKLERYKRQLAIPLVLPPPPDVSK